MDPIVLASSCNERNDVTTCKKFRQANDINRANVKKDAQLLLVGARVNGRKVRILIDSKDTRRFISLEKVLELGLRTVKEDSILEIADGSKQVSKCKCPHVRIVMGSATTIADLTMTALLPRVEIILGMDWLTSVNTLIDWAHYRLHMNGAFGRTFISCQDGPVEEYQSGSVIVLKSSLHSSPEFLNSLETLKSPQFWSVSNLLCRGRQSSARESTLKFLQIQRRNPL